MEQRHDGQTLMYSAFRTKAVALRRAATLDSTTDGYQPDPVLISLMLEIAAELEAEADRAEGQISALPSTLAVG